MVEMFPLWFLMFGSAIVGVLVGMLIVILSFEKV